MTRHPPSIEAELMEYARDRIETRARQLERRVLSEVRAEISRRHDPKACPECAREKATGIIDPDYGL